MKINQRLFDHYGIDTTKDLKMVKSCARPFDTILVDKQGSCYACECTSWLPQSVGNLQVKSLDRIIDSGIRQHLQASISDGTYRYCNEHQCSYIRANKFYETAESKIKHLRLAIDDSCNLRCPSCRTSMIFHKVGSAYNLGIRLADSINEWLQKYKHPVQVHIGSDGDPFASHIYRHFMRHTPQKDNIKYSILTNGLMFREFSGTVPRIIENLKTLGVSIDGASKETYEKLRLGGKWDKILEGLEYMALIKKKHHFSFNLHMVVQQENWHEMENMLELGHRYSADRVYFNKIEDWNTGINFESQNFTQLDEFKNAIKRVNTDPIAWDNVANLV